MPKKKHKNALQAERNARGANFEAEVSMALARQGFFHRKLLTGFAGTPFDIVAASPAGAWAIECKRTSSKALPYSSFTDNEIIGMTSFEQGPTTRSVVFVNIKTATENRLFLVPWCLIRDQVASGVRGSVKYQEHIEVPRRQGYWDLSILRKGDWICKLE